MKKLLFIAAALAILATSLLPAFAHGCHGGNAAVSQAANYTVCATKTCTLSGQHTHSGKTYIAHYYGDGHTYHAYCVIEDCEIAGYHSHDGEYCFAHTINDGHSYHSGRGGHH